MKLHRLRIQNFRKLNNVEILFADATFLIGANNSGKSSTLEAIDILLNGAKLTNECRSRYMDADSQKEIADNRDIIIEGEFIDVSLDIIEVHGFNLQRLKKYKDENGNERFSFNYRVRLDENEKMHIEMKLHRQELKLEYAQCNAYQDFITLGVKAELFQGKNLSKRLTATEKKDLENIPILYNILEEEEWIENPGGIPGNVKSQLPRFLKIKAAVLEGEMGDKSGALYEILDILFGQVRDQSTNYQTAVQYLEKLQQELDPNNSASEFGKMMNELNNVVSGVFPKSKIKVATDLTGADTLKAKYSITLSSNVETSITHQGTGMIRSAVFALLRYKKNMGRKAREEI